MKRLLIALLCLSLLGVAPALAEEDTHIVFWHCASDNVGALVEGYVADFNATVGAEHHIVVEAVFQGSYNDAVTKMNSMIGTETMADLPDVLQMDATGKISYLNSGAAYTVDAAQAEFAGTDLAADLSQTLPAALANWNVAGSQLGLPFATSTTVTYYNKTALDAVGASAPETLADIGALAPLFEGDGRIIYACLPNTPTLANWLGQLGSYLVNGSNGTEGAATALDCIENGALERFLTAWSDLYVTGALSNTAGSTDAFVAGQQLIMTSSSSSIHSVRAKVDGAFEVGIAVYPKVDENASLGASVNGSCLAMFDHGDAARRKAAWLFAQYMAGADVQADFAANTGYLPSSAAADWEEVIAGNPEFAVGLRQLLETPASMRSVTVGPSADFYYTIQNDMADYLEDGMSPAEGAALLESDLNGLLEQYALANP